jgi:hypothetical protein
MLLPPGEKVDRYLKLIETRARSNQILGIAGPQRLSGQQFGRDLI